MIYLLNRVTKLPTFIHIAIAAAVILGYRWIGGALEASYAASNHPVDYFTGQTSFSAEKIKSYYAHMTEVGTLDVYVTTQVIDFGFIAAVMLMGLFVCTLIARIGRDGSIGRKLGLWAGASAIAGAVCDAIENAWSFIMLANPQHFSDWLALPYSGFAWLKFGFLTLAMVLLLFSILASLAGRLSGRERLG